VSALLQPLARAFRGAAEPVPSAVRARMEGVSWRGEDERCPRWDELAYARVAHIDFTGAAAEGELVVAAALGPATLALFRRLWQLGFPIRQLRLVDDFGGSDDESMAADNSSAFNFRVIAGTALLSQHALGRAIDLNPVENPWRRAHRIDPPAGAAFADRRAVRPGMIVRPGPVCGALDELGWGWGGDWIHAADDHHLAWLGPLPAQGADG
jgi:poly-gamma-glutamate synthesis protein (capsule biosynthesis protein)